METRGASHANLNAKDKMKHVRPEHAHFNFLHKYVIRINRSFFMPWCLVLPHVC